MMIMPQFLTSILTGVAVALLEALLVRLAKAAYANIIAGRAVA
jgi:hypothetical protein